MIETRQHFANRLNTLGAKHQKLSRGYTVMVDRNGLIVAQPKCTRRYFPLKGITMLILGFFVFKAFTLSVNGPEAYQERLAMLENGTIIEVFGAKIMGLDPVTVGLAESMGPLMR